jgi:hypothetical protein
MILLCISTSMLEVAWEQFWLTYNTMWYRFRWESLDRCLILATCNIANSWLIAVRLPIQTSWLIAVRLPIHANPWLIAVSQTANPWLRNCKSTANCSDPWLIAVPRISIGVPFSRCCKNSSMRLFLIGHFSKGKTTLLKFLTGSSAHSTFDTRTERVGSEVSSMSASGKCWDQVRGLWHNDNSLIRTF